MSGSPTRRPDGHASALGADSTQPRTIDVPQFFSERFAFCAVSRLYYFRSVLRLTHKKQQAVRVLLVDDSGSLQLYSEEGLPKRTLKINEDIVGVFHDTKDRMTFHCKDSQDLALTFHRSTENSAEMTMKKLLGVVVHFLPKHVTVSLVDHAFDKATQLDKNFKGRGPAPKMMPNQGRPAGGQPTFFSPGLDNKSALAAPGEVPPSAFDSYAAFGGDAGDDPKSPMSPQPTKDSSPTDPSQQVSPMDSTSPPLRRRGSDLMTMMGTPKMTLSPNEMSPRESSVNSGEAHNAAANYQIPAALRAGGTPSVASMNSTPQAGPTGLSRGEDRFSLEGDRALGMADDNDDPVGVDAEGNPILSVSLKPGSKGRVKVTLEQFVALMAKERAERELQEARNARQEQVSAAVRIEKVRVEREKQVEIHRNLAALVAAACRRRRQWLDLEAQIGYEERVLGAVRSLRLKDAVHPAASTRTAAGEHLSRVYNPSVTSLL